MSYIISMNEALESLFESIDREIALSEEETLETEKLLLLYLTEKEEE